MRFAAHQRCRQKHRRCPRRLLAIKLHSAADGAAESFHKTTQSQTRRCRYRTPCLLPPALLCQPPDRIPHKLPPHNTSQQEHTRTQSASLSSVSDAPQRPHATLMLQLDAAAALLPRPLPALIPSYLSLTHTALFAQNHCPLKTPQFRWSAHWKRSGSYSHFSGKGRMLVAPTIMSAVFLRRRKTFCWTYGTLYFSQIARMRGADF